MAALGPFEHPPERAPPPAFDTWFAARCPQIRLAGARAVLELAAEGATVPFIARYRKERTGNLDEAAVRRVLEAKELLGPHRGAPADHPRGHRAPEEAHP